MRQCSVIVHHGGAGTTQAALRAGVPTIVTPVAVDQFEWAPLTVKLGCGQHLSLVENNDKMMDPAWTKAMRKASSDAAMIARAKEVAEEIRQERGTESVLERIQEVIEKKARGDEDVVEKFGC
mmetsp:Transcript_117585/g.366278  ORF Transcript_117585/g.366278 Transcript_117585/m.366278 type:complete len:123 (-) Transcript_117585:32-400(-)